VRLRNVYADPRFWRLAPLSATSIGTAWADSGRRSGSTLCFVLGSYAGKGKQRLFIKRNDHATMSAASARSVHLFQMIKAGRAFAEAISFL
jgi:hypothetical protein